MLEICVEASRVNLVSISGTPGNEKKVFLAIETIFCDEKKQPITDIVVEEVSGWICMNPKKNPE